MTQARWTSVAQVILDPESLQDERNHLWKVFVNNGYRPWDISWALNKLMSSSKNFDESEMKKKMVVLPQYSTISSKIGRLVSKWQENQFSTLQLRSDSGYVQ